MKKKSIICCCMVLIANCFVSAALAKIQGGSVQVMKPKPLAIHRQDITLSLDKINSTAVYMNNSALDIIETMVFTPPYNDSAPKKLQFEEQPFNQLDIIVDGRKVEYKALAQGQKQLQPRNNNSNNALKPATYYYWQQRFPPAVEVHIMQSFKPNLRIYRSNVQYKYKTAKKSKKSWLPKMLQKNQANAEQDEQAQLAKQHDKQEIKQLQDRLNQAFPYINQFCPSKADYQSLLATFTTAAPEKTLVTRELQYQLVNNDNWSGPIEFFTLKIEHPENMLVLSCWPDKFNKTSYNTLMFSANNYTPSQDIAVLFVQK